MCTGIKLTADNGDIVYARTMEFDTPLPECIGYFPRGQGFVGAFLVSLPAAARGRLEAALRLAWGPEDGPRSFVATARLCQGRLPASL